MISARLLVGALRRPRRRRPCPRASISRAAPDLDAQRRDLGDARARARPARVGVISFGRRVLQVARARWRPRRRRAPRVDGGADVVVRARRSSASSRAVRRRRSSCTRCTRRRRAACPRRAPPTCGVVDVVGDLPAQRAAPSSRARPATAAAATRARSASNASRLPSPTRIQRLPPACVTASLRSARLGLAASRPAPGSAAVDVVGDRPRPRRRRRRSCRRRCRRAAVGGAHVHRAAGYIGPIE